MLNNLFKKHQSLLIGLGIFALMMLAASMFSFGGFSSQHHAIYALSSWLRQHKFLVILWHIFIIAAIYWGWGLKVDLAAKNVQMDEIKIKKLKRFRWVLIVMFLLIDFLCIY
jgi:hypothetical protein